MYKTFISYLVPHFFTKIFNRLVYDNKSNLSTHKNLVKKQKIQFDKCTQTVFKQPCLCLHYETISKISSHNNKLELQSACNFLVHLIKLGRRNINENQLEKFNLALVEVLRRRYRDHWFPEKPFKGSGYRCIRINGKMDPVIAQAGESCGFSPSLIHSTFPSELTMWIDPLEVSYRIGENGSICVLYEHKEGVNEPWRPNIYSKNLTATSKILTTSTTATTSTTTSIVPCKDSLRKMDYLLDPRKSVSIEQLAAYVNN